MILNTDGFLLDKVLVELGSKELKVLIKLCEYMDEDNRISLYNDEGRDTIDYIMSDIRLSRKDIQNAIYRITTKTTDILYTLDKGIYVINPDVAIHDHGTYDNYIFKVQDKVNKQIPSLILFK
jgi:peptide subunit release factor 1 (eRF1)